MLLSFLIFQIQIADWLSIPTVNIIHNYCILWMVILWTLKCHHSPICSAAVTYFPADNIQCTCTHNAEVSTTFITLMSGHTVHAVTDQQKQFGLEDLQSSPSSFRLCTYFPWLICCSCGKELRHGCLPVSMVLKTGGCRGPLSEWPSSLVDTAVHWFPAKAASATAELSAPWGTSLWHILRSTFSVNTDEALSRIRRCPEKHHEILLHSQVMWSKCQAVQKQVPGRSVVLPQEGWFSPFQSRAWNQKPQYIASLHYDVHPAKIAPTQEFPLQWWKSADES